MKFHQREQELLQRAAAALARQVTIEPLATPRAKPHFRRPDGLRLDNGPEFTSRCFIAWAEQRGVPLICIQPGKPVQNSYIESFNGRFRDECLNANWFENLADARRKIEAWRLDYNQARPHGSLAYRTPEEFARAKGEMVKGDLLVSDGV